MGIKIDLLVNRHIGLILILKEQIAMLVQVHDILKRNVMLLDVGRRPPVGPLIVLKGSGAGCESDRHRIKGCCAIA